MVDNNQQSKGVILAIAAFVWWGLAPVYFKLLADINVFEIMSHRIIWSLFSLVLVIILLKRPFRLLEILKTPSLLLGLTASGLLISANWTIYVWSVANNQVLATSLGYFINPLISVALGMIFLGEKLNNRQLLALVLVVFAVFNQIWQFGEIPWISLSLAFSFGLYGLIRKTLNIDSFNGLLAEVILATPFAIAFLYWKFNSGDSTSLTLDIELNLLLMLLGIITVVPMALFAASVKMINLSTMGFIQYLAPSLSFGLAVFIFHEPLGNARLFSFLLIWIALLFISWDTIKNSLLKK